MGEFPVAKNNDNTLNREKIPIVFVPGVMGSRLGLPLVFWDPDDQARMIPFTLMNPDVRRQVLQCVDVFGNARDAIVLRGDGQNKDFDLVAANVLTAQQVARGWGTIVRGFYLGLLGFLEGITFGTFDTPVYALGYDWRKSNQDSGAALAGQIHDILKHKENATKVIIVTHSMGGLAIRSALQNDAHLSTALVGVLHLQQPVNGAVVFYRRFYTGMLPEDSPSSDLLTSLGFRFVGGIDGLSFATGVCQLRGPTELLPTPNYQDLDGDKSDWIHYFDTNQQPPAPKKQGVQDWSAYHSSSGHPPALDLGVTLIVSSELRKRVDEAKKFHDGLGLFKHERSWSIFTDRITTDVAFRMDASGKVQFPSDARRENGDQTVPSYSASALFPGQRHSPIEICDGDPRQFKLDGISHGGAPNDPTVRDLIDKIIRKMLGIQCFPTVPLPEHHLEEEKRHKDVPTPAMPTHQQ